ncbi:MAG TPA: histidine kinase [Thermoanaerobaculia bacterium]|nr:histidine kinase [Thermoanaerobaculia bacterium]
MRRGAIIVAGWTLCGALLAAQAFVSAAMRGEPAGWARPLAIWLTWAWLWALLTPAILRLTARHPFGRSNVLRTLAVHAASSIVAVAINLGLFALVAPLVGAASASGSWSATFLRLVGSTFLLDLPAYWLLVILAETIRLWRLEAQLAEARLLALKAQLQPHFLFNALNTVSVLMREDVDAAEDVLVRLSALLRRTLDSSAKHEVPLREELAVLEAYLEIERVRFVDRLAYRIDVAPDAEETAVPPLILQPLVENAVRHGIARRVSPGRIEIAVARRGDRVRMSVRDDGPGIEAGARDGVGLSNTRARLEQLYGSRHSFEVTNAPEGGALVAMEIPA